MELAAGRCCHVTYRWLVGNKVTKTIEYVHIYIYMYTFMEIDCICQGKVDESCRNQYMLCPIQGHLHG